MKRILLIVLISSLCFSCEKFLDLVPKNQVVVYSMKDVKAEMSSYLYTMSCASGNRVVYHNEQISFPLTKYIYGCMCMYSDDIEMAQFLTDYVTRGGYKDAYYQNVGWEGTDWATDYWYSSYINIGFLNTILKDLSNAPEEDNVWRERISGEARVFRAYHAFRLLQLFAPYDNDKLGIPLTLNYDQVGESGRWTQTQVYDYLTSELKDVLGYTALPDAGWNVMYNRNTIHAILAQVYWYKAMSAAASENDWKNAEIHSAEVMKTYALVNSIEGYKEIFSPNVQNNYIKNNPNALLIIGLLGRGTYREGIWGSISDGPGNVQYPSRGLKELFSDPGDIRLEAFFDIYDEDGFELQYINKYVYKQNADDIVVLFRTDDIYLINAEAKARQQDLDGAKTVLENFKKAKIPGYTTFSGDVMDEILKERRKEFCFENDQRWLDMKRLNLPVSRKGWKVDETVVSEFSLKAADHRYALPIPVESEIMYNPIEQNPGWVNVK